MFVTCSTYFLNKVKTDVDILIFSKKELISTPPLSVPVWETECWLVCSILDCVEKACHYAKLDKSQIHVLILMGDYTHDFNIQKLLQCSLNGKQLTRTSTPLRLLFIIHLSRQKSYTRINGTMFWQRSRFSALGYHYFSHWNETPGEVKMAMTEHNISMPTQQQRPSLLTHTTTSVHLL